MTNPERGPAAPAPLDPSELRARWARIMLGTSYLPPDDPVRIFVEEQLLPRVDAGANPQEKP